MKFKGTVIGEASGSLASVTFSHNRGGQYTRQRAIPVNPGSSFQQVIRNTVATLTSGWQGILTAAQRAAWDVYAEQVLIADTLGEPRNIGGLGQYVRCNVPRIQASVARLDDAPTTYNLGSFTNPTIAALTASTDILTLAFTNTDAWASAVGGYMYVYMSRPMNASINYFKGPYRFAAKVSGAATPPTSPASITAPFPFAVGNKVAIQLRVQQVDGRLSAPFRLAGLGV